MYERMLDKSIIPSEDSIYETVGEDAFMRLSNFESRLNSMYDLNKELKFPFGNHYGWGYKYGHKNKHLCYVFFEKNAFTVFTQIGDKQVEAIEKKLNGLSDHAKEVWEKRYPCGEKGGWINFRVLHHEEIDEVLEFIQIKVKAR